MSICHRKIQRGYRLVAEPLDRRHQQDLAHVLGNLSKRREHPLQLVTRVKVVRVHRARVRLNAIRDGMERHHVDHTSRHS